MERTEDDEQERPLPAYTKCRAVFNFEGTYPQDLSFCEGEILTLLEPCNVVFWYLARQQDGTEGIIPINYVELVQDLDVQAGVPTIVASHHYTPTPSASLVTRPDEHSPARLPGPDEHPPARLPGPDERPPVRLPGPDEHPPARLPGPDERPPARLPGPGERPPVRLPGPDERPPARLPGPDERPPARLPGPDECPPARLPGPDERPPARLPGPDERPPARLPGPDQSFKFKKVMVPPISEGKYKDMNAFRTKSGWFYPSLDEVLMKKIQFHDLSAFQKMRTGIFIFLHKTIKYLAYVGKSYNVYSDLMHTFESLYINPQSSLTPVQVHLKGDHPDAKNWTLRLYSCKIDELDFEFNKHILQYKTLQPEGLNKEAHFRDKSSWTQFCTFYMKNRKLFK